MKPGGKDNQGRREDAVDRTASIWLTSLGRSDDRGPDRKVSVPERVTRKTRQTTRK